MLHPHCHHGLTEALRVVSVAEEPVLHHFCLGATWDGAAGEACCQLCGTLLKAVDRHRVQAIGGLQRMRELLSIIKLTTMSPTASTKNAQNYLVFILGFCLDFFCERFKDEIQSGHIDCATTMARVEIGYSLLPHQYVFTHTWFCHYILSLVFSSHTKCVISTQSLSHSSIQFLPHH